MMVENTYVSAAGMCIAHSFVFVRYWVHCSVLNCRYPDVFMVFLSVSIQVVSYYLNLCHDHFLPCHFQSIV